MPRVIRIDVHSAELPFRFAFGHALASRRSTTNVYARVVLDDGSVGHGEGVPRGYVTGETFEGAVSALVGRFAPALAGRALEDPGAVEDALTTTAVHGRPFAAAVERDMLSATQFHPEKSGDAGAALLKNWVGTL